jgi:hypothetical protein
MNIRIQLPSSLKTFYPSLILIQGPILLAFLLRSVDTKTSRKKEEWMNDVERERG